MCLIISSSVDAPFRANPFSILAAHCVSECYMQEFLVRCLAVPLICCFYYCRLRLRLTSIYFHVSLIDEAKTYRFMRPP